MASNGCSYATHNTQHLIQYFWTNAMFHFVFAWMSMCIFLYKQTICQFLEKRLRFSIIQWIEHALFEITKIAMVYFVKASRWDTIRLKACVTLSYRAHVPHAWSFWEWFLCLGNKTSFNTETKECGLEIGVLTTHQRTQETYGAEYLHSDQADHGVHVTPSMCVGYVRCWICIVSSAVNLKLEMKSSKWRLNILKCFTIVFADTRE